MKYKFFFQCDYSFHDLSLRRAYLSIYYTPGFLELLDSAYDRHP